MGTRKSHLTRSLSRIPYSRLPRVRGSKLSPEGSLHLVEDHIVSAPLHLPLIVSGCA